MRHLTQLAVMLLFGVFFLSAQVPQLINYQGFLKDDNGQPLTGQVKLEFRIYNVVTGGTVMWSEVRNQVNVNNGLFNVLLGSVTSFPQTIFRSAGERFLEIVVDDNALPKRFQITSVAYALKSGITDDVGDNSITGVKIQDGQIVRSLNSLTDKVNIGAGANVFITQVDDTIKISAQTGTGEVADGSITTPKLADNAVVSSKISDGAVRNADIANNDITADKIAADQVVKSLNTQTGSLKDKVFLESGANITISTPNDTTISIAASGGDISGVTAGDYLSGGGSSGDVTLHLSKAATDTVYINYGEANTVSTNMLQNAAVTAAKISDEPGIVVVYGPAYFSLTNTTDNQEVASITIDAPAAGRILVEASGYISIEHTYSPGGLDSTDNVGINIVTSVTNDIWVEYGIASCLVPHSCPTDEFRFPFCCRNVFTIATAGSYTYYLVVQQSTGAHIDYTDVRRAVLTATYFSTVY